MNSPTFNIYIPSYKRAKTACTHKILEYYTYVVRQSELQDYIDAGIDPDHIWAVEDSEINNLVKVVNYIVDNAPEDIICMIDDDVPFLYYRLDTYEKITEPETVTAEFERIGQLISDLRIGYASVDASISPWNYGSEFEFKGTSGGMRWFNKPCYKSR